MGRLADAPPEAALLKLSEQLIRNLDVVSCIGDDVAVCANEQDRAAVLASHVRVRGVEPESEVFHALVGVVQGFQHVEAEAVHTLCDEEVVQHVVHLLPAEVPGVEGDVLLPPVLRHLHHQVVIHLLQDVFFAHSFRSVDYTKRYTMISTWKKTQR